MPHLSYNNVPLQRGMFVFQIGSNGNQHLLFRFKIQELLDSDLVRISSISDDPRIVQNAVKTVPAKNLHTDPKELLNGRLAFYEQELNKNIPEKISDIKKILDTINSGMAYTITGHDLSENVEI